MVSDWRRGRWGGEIKEIGIEEVPEEKVAEWLAGEATVKKGGI